MVDLAWYRRRDKQKEAARMGYRTKAEVNEVIRKVNAGPGPADEELEEVVADLVLVDGHLTIAEEDEALSKEVSHLADLEAVAIAEEEAVPEPEPSRDWPTYIDLKDIWDLLEGGANKSLWTMVGEALEASTYSTMLSMPKSKAKPLEDAIKHLRGMKLADEYVRLLFSGLAGREEQYRVYADLRRAVGHDELMVAECIVEATRIRCL